MFRERMFVNRRAKNILEKQPLKSSAPCRIDMGGTLDIGTFYYPMLLLRPCTFNAALSLRTSVRLKAYRVGRVRVTSRGFRSAEFASGRAPYLHPMGLMFAVAAAFGADGIHIEIESTSPPRSALGGSSAAAVALAAAFMELRDRQREENRFSRKNAAFLAHEIEAGIAGVPCGFQDQLAAAYGGVNLWTWQGCESGRRYQREPILSGKHRKNFVHNFLVAYCGIPHESKNINGVWVKRFLAGKDRDAWRRILETTRRFAQAISTDDIETAVAEMKRELNIRRKITPDVLDAMGKKLVASAEKLGCGARFTGAGGGGCIWALGSPENIAGLRDHWEIILSERKEACLLDAGIDTVGVKIHN
jgi:D-glycero-alpha-D-manno-heptose-7-phosphate kinase